MKIVIISGYFNPLHGGHLDLIEDAKKLGDKLVVIVNNDKQQLKKKSKIILDEKTRLRVVKALRKVDDAFICLDGTENDSGQAKCFNKIAEKYPNDELIFANGGDRGNRQLLPTNEVKTADELGIELVFGIGGKEKADSSTRINQATGDEE